MKNISVAKIIKKRLAQFVFYLLLVIISLPIVLTVFFRSPLVQTFSARMITKWVAINMDRSVSIEALSYSFYDGLYLSGLKAYDHKDSLMMEVGSLLANPNFPWIGQLNFKNIVIDQAFFTYGRYENEDEFAFMTFLGLDSTSKKDGNSKFMLHTDQLRLTNSYFRLFDKTKHYTNEKGMDYADIQILGINGQVKDFYLVNDSLNLEIVMLQAVEKCGIKIEHLNSNFSISSSGLRAHNTRLSTGRSTLNFDIDFDYSSYAAMSYFIDSVDMSGEIRNSELDLYDLGYFSDIMFRMPDKITLNGSVNGKVNELSGDNIFLEYADNTSFTGDIYMKGLPDFYNTFIRLGIQDFRTSKCDIQKFILPIDAKTIDVPLELECKDNISVTGSFIGYYGNFNSQLQIGTPSGKLVADVNFNENRNDSVYLHSKLSSESIDIGKILKIKELTSPLSFNAEVELIGINMNDLEYKIDSYVKSVGIMDYNFSRMRFNALYSSNILESKFRIGDKNLLADGNFKIKLDEIQTIEINADIVKANISNLISWDYDDLGITTNLQLKTQGSDIDAMTIDLKLDNSRINLGEDIFDIESINLQKFTNIREGNVIDLKSNIIDFRLTGDYLLSTIGSNSVNLINHFYSISDTISNDTISKYADLSLEVKDNRILLNHFVKGLDLENGTKAHLFLNFQEKIVNFDLSTDNIFYQGIGFIDSDINIRTKNDKLDLLFNVNNILIKDSTESDKTVLGLDNFKLHSALGADYLDLDMSWKDPDSIILNNGFIDARMKHDSAHEVINFNAVDVHINSVNWKVDTTSRVYFNSEGFSIEDLTIFADKSQLEIDGRIYGNESDTLEVVFDEWDISHFDILTLPYNVDLDGIVNGYLNFRMISKNPTFISNLTLDNFSLNSQYLGKVRLLNTWDNVNESVYFKGQIIDNGTDDLSEMLLADGYYYPFRDKDVLDIKLQFTDFKLPVIEPFLASYVSEIRGKTSGEINLRGTVDDPIITGYAKINETSLIIKYLNTRYSFSNLIVFEEDILHFDKLVLFDTIGNRASIKGFLKHDNFKNPWLDVSLSTEKLLFFNTTRKMNSLYYGKGIMSGDIKIKGKPNDIKLNIITTTKQGTRVFLPLDYSTTVSDKDYIIFVKTEKDSIAEAEAEEILRLKRAAEENELKYAIDLGMKITPTARIFISMPGDMGEIEAQGSGDLSLDFNSDGEFGLYGEYIVSRGLFNFTIENLVNKRFELVEGGRISWTGDPYTANINLQGLYKVKANLSSLGVVIDSSASYKNKVNVECYINLRNQLLNPTISFEIKMPDLDPDMQRAVYAQLDTTNKAMLNQQMISLLVLGTFSYSNASNINLSSSYYTILTNQLSGMLSQISDDFDIGVNYKPGDDLTNEEFEVALSTQLFEDRLIVDGNFGVTYDRSQQNASNIVGDVDVAYKLTEDGRWILKAYNHSNVNSWYNYSNYDKISPYTQGVGIAFRRDFNKFSELFKRVRPKKEKKKK